MQLERPIVLAVVGDSAAGKTTLTDGIAEILGPDRVTKVSTDDYHRYDRAERRIRNLTPLHPDCNYLDILELDLKRLCRGEPILKPVYDHRDGTLSRPEYVLPKPFIIVEGLFGLYTERMRGCFDVRVYLDPAEELRRMWKIARDTTKRGYTPNEVLRDLERREPDAARYIRPQRAHADIVVRFYPGASEASNGSHLNVRLVLRPTIPHPDLSEILEDASEGPVRLTLGRDEGLPVDFLEIDGHVTTEETARVEQAIWRSMPAAVRPLPAAIGLYADRFERRHSDPLAITQALITYHLLRKAHAVTSRTVRWVP